VILNEMICPRCGHVSYTECSYVTCAACGVMFYAAQGARRSSSVAATAAPSPSAFRVLVNNGAVPADVVPVISLADR
jgi:ribosomal protein L37E